MEQVLDPENPGAPIPCFFDIYARVSMALEASRQSVFETLGGVRKELRSPGAIRVVRFMKDHIPSASR